MSKKQLVSVQTRAKDDWDFNPNTEITRHELVDDLNDSARLFIRNKHAQNTQNAYQSDVRMFTEWCLLKRIAPVNATAAQICNFLAEQASGRHSRWKWINKNIGSGALINGAPLALSTIQRRLTGVRFALKQFGRTFNEHEKTVFRELLQGIAAENGTKKRKVQGITPVEIEILFKDLDLTDHIDLRDRALIMLLFAGAYRRSEISNMLVKNIKFIEGQGMIITHDRVKGKLDGITKAIVTGKHLCPIQFLKEYLEAANITDGFVFRRSSKTRRMQEGPISGKAICLMIQRRCAKAGLEGLYGGHSGRRGFVDCSIRAGKPISKVMEKTGHRSLQMIQEYFDEHRKWEENAGEDLY